MDNTHRESDRLISTRECVAKHFPKYGPNKAREVTRLIYEISKRDGIPPGKIVSSILSDLLDGRPNTAQGPARSGEIGYEDVKRSLILRRYPRAAISQKDINPYLPKIELRKDDLFTFRKERFYPKDIFYEKSSADSSMVSRLKSLFPLSRFTEIEKLKTHLKKKRTDPVHNLNHRRETLFIVEESYDFFKKCPCTKGAMGCGYHVMNLGFGCIYDCTYCFLQEYSNSPGLILPSNIDRYLVAADKYLKPGMRIGTGEFTDSLALDDITLYSQPLIEYFSLKKDVTFEFKTKSANIDNVLKSKPSRNIVIGWSVNPEALIKENENYAASLKERLDAAKRCARHGFRVAFHFDPVIYYDGWESDYEAVTKMMFDSVREKDIAWISLGTFRFSTALKPMIEKRFPDNKILDEELIIGYDGKLRYPEEMRLSIYKTMWNNIRKHSSGVHMYLCMEEGRICKTLGDKTR